MKSYKTTNLLPCLIVQAIEDLKLPVRKRHSYLEYQDGCPKKAQEFIMSKTFLEICDELDYDGKVIRKKLTEMKLLPKK